LFLFLFSFSSFLIIIYSFMVKLIMKCLLLANFTACRESERWLLQALPSTQDLELAASCCKHHCPLSGAVKNTAKSIATLPQQDDKLVRSVISSSFW
jgi:hypothetical protein